MSIWWFMGLLAALSAPQGDAELAGLRRHLELPANVEIAYAERVALPSGKSLRLYVGAGSNDRARRRLGRWIEEWNREYGAKYAYLEAVSEQAAADVILSLNVRWTSAETSFVEMDAVLDPRTLQPIVRSAGGVRVDVPVVAHVLVRMQDRMAIAWHSRRNEGNSVPEKTEREMCKVLAGLLKARAGGG